MNARSRFTQWLAICLLAGASAAAAAQTSSDANVAPVAAAKQAREIARGDPARWYREDTTAAQRMKTQQKEANAARDEARNACRHGPAAERPACLKAAQETWQQEMTALRAEAPAQAGT